MTNMSTENMAKGLNVYRSGPKGAATKAVTGRTVEGISTRRHPKVETKLAPLRFSKQQKTA